MQTAEDRQVIHEVALLAEREGVGFDEALRRYLARADGVRKYAATRVVNTKGVFRPIVHRGPQLISSTAGPPVPMPRPVRQDDHNVPRLGADGLGDDAGMGL